MRLPTNSKGSALQAALDGLERPVLVLSTVVGRGMYSLGEALVERLGARSDVHHVPVEETLPRAGVREDLERYRAISNRFPALLNIVYRFPLLYWRKLWRETHLARTDLGLLERAIVDRGARSVLCVSHRPAFWTACLKVRAKLDVSITGLLGEYGSNLGWRYIAWQAMDAFLSPVPRTELGFEVPPHVRWTQIELPARRAFEELASRPGDPEQVLVVCGYWGQGDLLRIVEELHRAEPTLTLHVVCGENEKVRRAIAASPTLTSRVQCHGVVDSLLPFVEKSGSLVTKPGISTLLEAHAARRALFLLRGMPVAEDNNMRFAMRHFDAQPFDVERFCAWLEEARRARAGR